MTWRGGFGVLVAVIVMIAAVWVPQWLAYEEASQRLRIEQDVYRKERRALEITTSKLEEFEKEVRLVDAKLDRLALILPPTMDVDGFVAGYRPLCEKFGFKITEVTPAREESRDFYGEAKVRLTLSGDPKRLPELRKATFLLPRLVLWKETLGSGPPAIELSMFSWVVPSDASRRDRRPCAERREANVIWPFARRLGALLEDTERLCADMARFDPIRKQVDAFQRKKKVLEDKVAIIEKLRAEPGGEASAPPR
jgi:Tfp pilus assembly protein PilO